MEAVELNAPQQEPNKTYFNKNRKKTWMSREVTSLPKGMTFEELEQSSQSKRFMQQLSAASLSSGFDKLRRFAKDHEANRDVMNGVALRFVDELGSRLEQNGELEFDIKHLSCAASAIGQFLPADRKAQRVMVAIAKHSQHLVQNAKELALFGLLEGFSSFKYKHNELAVVNSAVQAIVQELLSMGDNLPLTKVHVLTRILLKSTPDAVNFVSVHSLLSRITERVKDSMAEMTLDKLAMLARSISFCQQMIEPFAQFTLDLAQQAVNQIQTLTPKDIALIMSALSRCEFSEEELALVRPLAAQIVLHATSKIDEFTWQDLEMLVSGISLLNRDELTTFSYRLNQSINHREENIHWKSYCDILRTFRKFTLDYFDVYLNGMSTKLHANWNKLNLFDLVSVARGLAGLADSVKPSIEFKNVLWKLAKKASEAHMSAESYRIIANCLSKFSSIIIEDRSFDKFIGMMGKKMLVLGARERSMALDLIAKTELDLGELMRAMGQYDLLDCEWNDQSAALAIHALTTMNALNERNFNRLVMPINFTKLSPESLGRLYQVYHYCKQGLKWGDERWPAGCLNRIQDYSWTPSTSISNDIREANDILAARMRTVIKAPVGIYFADILIPETNQIIDLAGCSKFKKMYVESLGYQVIALKKDYHESSNKEAFLTHLIPTLQEPKRPTNRGPLFERAMRGINPKEQRRIPQQTPKEGEESRGRLFARAITAVKTQK